MATNLSDLSQEELQACFDKYLLSSSFSMSSVTSNRIAKAFRFGLPLELTGARGLRYRRTMRLIRYLGIPCVEAEYTPLITASPDRWIEDPTVSGLRIWIVDSKYEDYNLGLFLQFYSEYHTKFIRQHEPDFPLPCIDATYLLFLLHLLNWKGEQALSNRIQRDLVTMERGALLSVPNTGSYCNDDARSAYGTLRDLQPTAQKFLGFYGGSLRDANIEIDAPLVNHTLNHRAREFIGAMSLTVSTSSDFRPPWYIRRFVWPIESSRTVADNAVYLHHLAGSKYLKDQDQVDEWLMNRLRGMKDEEISRVSQLSPDESQESWLKRHRISTGPPDKLTAVDDWLQACETLGIEPDPSDVGAQNAVWEHTKAPVHAPESLTAELPTGQASAAPERLGGFRSGPDFRSVVSADGRNFVLTSKQAEVIQMLHSAFENDTPEVSQAKVIEDIYPGSSERKLIRLFRDDEAYHALIQPGSRKGLIKLKLVEE